MTMTEQPALDGGGLVGGVVVEDQVDGQLVGHLGIDALEELPELARAVVPPERADDLPGHGVERGEQTRGAVTD